jgi:2-dehydropantoate 2-reductase
MDQWQDAGHAIQYTRQGVTDSTAGFDAELVTEEDSSHGDSASIKHLILLTKAYNTVSALSCVRARLNQESTVLFLQNGMGKA